MKDAFPSIAFSALEAAKLPHQVLFDLAQQMCALGRRADALELARSVPFETSASILPGAASHLASRHGVLVGFHRAVEIAALAAGAEGVGAVLASLAKRSGGKAPAMEPYQCNPPEPTQAWQIPASRAFDAVFKIDPAAAELLLRDAPPWVCLQGVGASSNSIALHDDQGLGLALSGQMPPALSRLYFERAGFAAGFGDFPQHQAHPKDHWPLKSAARHLTHEFEQGSASSRHLGEKAPAVELLRLAIEEASQRPLPQDLAQSPLPARWVPSIAFGVHRDASQALEAWLGSERIDAICAAEMAPIASARAAFFSGREDACLRLLRVHGAAVFACRKLEDSAVARAASALPAEGFERFLLQALASHPESLRESALHRFWAFAEEGARKMGDALAFCAAQGLPGHAKALLGAMPDLPRKDAFAIVKYMESRDVSFKNQARATWESVLLSDQSAPPAEPARAKTRL